MWARFIRLLLNMRNYRTRWYVAPLVVSVTFFTYTQRAHAFITETLASVAVSILLLIFIPPALFSASVDAFNTILQWTILDFSGTASSINLVESTQIIWELSRDIGNILLIGVFVYMAIGLILGIKGMGRSEAQKIAINILVVALLINFSYLFALVAIDMSNWLTVQIYNTVVHSSRQEFGDILAQNISGVTNLRDLIPSTGDFIWDLISGLFTAVWDILKKMGSGVILTTIAAVLFFRLALILLTRWITLIFLTITSAAAFAAMLIPAYKKYWTYWYRGLLHNTVLAPMLLLLLSVSVILTNTIYKALSSSNLPGAETIATLICIVFFWAALTIATKLADKTAESAGSAGKWISDTVNWAQNKTIGRAVGWVPGAAGQLGRDTFGQSSQWMANRLNSMAANRPRNSISRRMLAGLSKSTQTGVADRSFDARSLSAIQSATKASGFELSKGIQAGFKKELDARNKRDDALDEEQIKIAEKRTERLAAAYSDISSQIDEKKRNEKQADKDAVEAQQAREKAEQAYQAAGGNGAISDTEKKIRTKDDEIDNLKKAIAQKRSQNEDTAADIAILGQLEEQKENLEDRRRRLDTLSSESVRLAKAANNARAASQQIQSNQSHVLRKLKGRKKQIETQVDKVIKGGSFMQRNLGRLIVPGLAADIFAGGKHRIGLNKWVKAKQSERRKVAEKLRKQLLSTSQDKGARAEAEKGKKFRETLLKLAGKVGENKS